MKYCEVENTWKKTVIDVTDIYCKSFSHGTGCKYWDGKCMHPELGSGKLRI